MGKIYLVRHGQASLGKDNYDQLSPLGANQSLRLGEYLKECGLLFEAAYCGSLIRQQHTLTQVLKGLQTPDVDRFGIPQLNEYDSHAIIKCVHQGPIPNTGTEQGYRDFFRLLRLGLISWMTMPVPPENIPPFTKFEEGVIQTLHSIQSTRKGSILVVSSGGPISTALAHFLGMNDQGRIEINLRLRNTSISELNFNDRAISVVSFNTLPHLAQPEYKDWITYA